MTNYEKLNEYLKQIQESCYISSILNWEMDIIAPKKSLDYLIEVKTKMEMKTFELATSEEYKTLLENLINSDEFPKLSEEEQRTLKYMLKDYETSSRVPSDFYEEYCTLLSNSQNAWVEAKEKNDYNIFKPFLKQVIDYTKKYYTYMHPNEDLYNSMLDTYERGVHKETIDKLFSDLKKEIIPIIKKLKSPKEETSKKKYTNQELLDVASYLLDYIGFDNSRGTLGIYPHGYTCKFNNDDVRIAFSNEKSIFDHVCTVIHEGGHGIFEQSLGKNLKHLAIVEVNNMALHESQSRFYENILGRNYNFWTPIFDKIKTMLNLDLTQEEFVSYLNKAQASLVRTEADELTYCLHIIMRYEIERDLFDNLITVDDLPRIWNEKTKEYLGLDIKEDKYGILQDVHWSQGNFGYFPSYLVGSIFDGMLLKNIEDNLGNIDELLKNNKIKDITKYLNDKIHSYGGAYSIEEVAKRVCNTPLTVEPLVEYFKNKYDK